MEDSGFDIPALAIVGPTASGKTALGFWLAEQGFPIEIISLDSALVFRDMNIGTAKPTDAELAAVPHHLISIISPEDTFSAADFLTACHGLIQDIRSRGKVPVILGGTMMYYNSLVMGMDDLPAANASVRADIEAQAADQGWPAIHARLAELDPITAERLKPNDSQRLQRALEVYLLTGRPLSSFHQRSQENIKRLPTLSVEPSDRAVLHERIETRFKGMLEDGLIEEVQALRNRYILDPNMTSMRCVGYRQVWDYLDGHVGYQTMIDKGVAATRQLAKRQITWLRSTANKQVFDPLEPQWMDTLAKPWLMSLFDQLQPK
jgi:tRNA dimethylallyltransferase